MIDEFRAAEEAAPGAAGADPLEASAALSLAAWERGEQSLSVALGGCAPALARAAARLLARRGVPLVEELRRILAGGDAGASAIAAEALARMECAEAGLALHSFLRVPPRPGSAPLPWRRRLVANRQVTTLYSVSSEADILNYLALWIESPDPALARRAELAVFRILLQANARLTQPLAPEATAMLRRLLAADRAARWVAVRAIPRFGNEELAAALDELAEATTGTDDLAEAARGAAAALRDRLRREKDALRLGRPAGSAPTHLVRPAKGAPGAEERLLHPAEPDDTDRNE